MVVPEEALRHLSAAQAIVSIFSFHYQYVLWLSDPSLRDLKMERK
jgi:hypothetical protein